MGLSVCFSANFEQLIGCENSCDKLLPESNFLKCLVWGPPYFDSRLSVWHSVEGFFVEDIEKQVIPLP